MKRKKYPLTILFVIIIVAACSPAPAARQKADDVTQKLATQMAPPTPTRLPDIAYAVDSFAIEENEYSFKKAWTMDEDYCQNGFPTTSWVSSHSTVIKLSPNTQITITLDTQSGDLNASIEVSPSDLVSSEDWEFMFKSGKLDLYSSITIAATQGSDTRYHSVVNCGFELVSK